MFCPLSEINVEELESVLDQMMYEGFENRESCFIEVLQMLKSVKNIKNLHIKSFIYSVNAFE